MHCTKKNFFCCYSVVTCVFNECVFFFLLQITDADARHNFTTSFSMSMVSLKHNQLSNKERKRTLEMFAVL